MTIFLLLIFGILVAFPASAHTQVGVTMGQTPEGDLLELPKENDPQTTMIYMQEPSSANVLSSSVRYMFVNASSFVPVNSNMIYAYNSGCIYHTGGLSLADYSLQLPQGAIITAMRLYFYDNSAEDASVSLYRCPGTGSCTSSELAKSSGTPGFSSAEVTASRTVDNSSEALVLRLSYADAVDSNLRICGVRIQYEYNPFSALFLPVVTR